MGIRALRRERVLTGAATALLVVLVGTAVAVAPVVSVGALAVAAVLGLSYWKPQAGIAVWLVTTVLVPAWLTADLGGFSLAPAYVALPVIVGVGLRAWSRARRPSGLDVSLIAAAVLVLVYQVAFDQATFLFTNVAVTLLTGYVLGRLASVSIERLFVIAMVVVALWGIVEFLTSWHPFTDFERHYPGIGPQVQERSGVIRSEATLGHAIGYGAALAAAIPSATLFRRAGLLQVILVAGVLVSVSRGPIIATAFTFALLVYAQRKARHRVTSALFLIAGLVGIYVLFSALYNGTGQEEVMSSGSARSRQLEGALPYTNLVGPAQGMFLNLEGQYQLYGIVIIDNAFLRIALDFGWLVCALMFLPVVVAAVNVLLRRAGRITVALVAQVPVLVVTSFITQWQTLFFFVMGMAVTEMVAARRQRHAARVPPAVLSDAATGAPTR